MLKLKTKRLLIRVMSLDQLWSKAVGKMPPKNTTRKKDAPAASPPVGDAMLADDATPSSASLKEDPGLTRALEVMTANITQMMDEKMALDIKANISQSLKEVTERVGEAEQRIRWWKTLQLMLKSAC